jgi:hypothetical protein
MTHDEMTSNLRELGWPPAIEVADRLDLYRDIIRRCEWRLPASINREDQEFRAALRRDIAEAFK